MISVGKIQDTKEFIKSLKQKLEEIKKEEDINKIKEKLQEIINYLNHLTSILDLIIYLYGKE